MARTASGRVRLSKSLLPRTSRFQASKRAPRKPSSSRLSDWIMVPMAPSMTRMRSAASRRSVVSVGDFLDADAIMTLRALLLMDGWGGALGGARTQPEQMAGCVDEISAVHGVEVKVGDTVVDQIQHLLGGDRGGDVLAGYGIVVEAVKALGEPGRDRGAAARRKRLRGLEILNGEDSRHDRDRYSGRAHALEIAEVEVVLEKELGHRARRTRIDLGLEHVDVGRDRRTIGMLLRIGRHRDFDVRDALDAGDEIGGVGIAAGMRRVFLTGAADRIAAQRHDVAYAGLRVSADHGVDLIAGRCDAGQMRRRRQRGFAEDALHRHVRSLAGRA